MSDEKFNKQNINLIKKIDEAFDNDANNELFTNINELGNVNSDINYDLLNKLKKEQLILQNMIEEQGRETTGLGFAKTKLLSNEEQGRETTGLGFAKTKLQNEQNNKDLDLDLNLIKGLNNNLDKDLIKGLNNNEINDENKLKMLKQSKDLVNYEENNKLNTKNMNNDELNKQKLEKMSSNINNIKNRLNDFEKLNQISNDKSNNSVAISRNACIGGFIFLVLTSHICLDCFDMLLPKFGRADTGYSGIIFRTLLFMILFTVLSNITCKYLKN
jgi:hypothetical protein